MPTQRVALGAGHVVVSELRAPAGSGPVLEEAFAHRLGEVEGHPGFVHLEVWRDPRCAERFLMVTWWQSHAHYAAYMRSDAHHRSHARVPGDPHRPRAVDVSLWEVVAR
ncbi:MAG: antibiotic biosynthesis monooxygenase family protein [Mycobacteriales bacterium]